MSEEGKTREREYPRVIVIVCVFAHVCSSHRVIKDKELDICELSHPREL